MGGVQAWENWSCGPFCRGSEGEAVGGGPKGRPKAAQISGFQGPRNPQSHSRQAASSFFLDPPTL